MRRSGLLAFVIALAALASPPAHARDAVVRSFDGTPIVTHFYGAPNLTGPNARAPTVLVGPGFGFGGDTSPDRNTSDTIGAAALRAAGYNVLTWDPRGFGGSGGTVMMNSPDFEGRDVQALLDFVARQPEAQLDKPGDPRAGMSGSSYGGTIQLVAAAIDPRVDVIIPDLAWHSLTTSLIKHGAVKTGWLATICGLGEVTGLAQGLFGSAGAQFGSLDGHLRRACVTGSTTSVVSAEDTRWLADRGPAGLVDRIRIPTLLTQGTVDTLFTPGEAISTFSSLRDRDVPVKMMWHCGGHGACTTGTGPPGHLQGAAMAWLNRWLKGDGRVDTGPAFEWLAVDGGWRSGPDYPLAPAGERTAAGSGSLVFSPVTDSVGSGTPQYATPAVNAVTIALPAPPHGSDVVGAPRLKLRYQGSATPARTFLYAQIIDAHAGRVLDNQVAPVPVTLDGRPRTVERALEPVAVRAGSGSDFRVQITPSSTVYGPQQSSGGVDLPHIEASLPLVDATRSGRPARAGAPAARRLPARPTLIVRVRRVRGGGHRLVLRTRLRSTPCSGTVTFRVRAGRTTRTRRARMSRRCAAQRVVRVRVRRGTRARVSARFGGNAQLRPRAARTRALRLR